MAVNGGAHGVEEYLEVKSIYGYEAECMIRLILAFIAIFGIAACGGDTAFPQATGKGTIRAINAITTSPEFGFLIEERFLSGVSFQARLGTAAMGQPGVHVQF